MSESHSLANAPPDPLGLRRCPGCLYDRLGIAEASPCPECGYVRPAGVAVFTFRRPTTRDNFRWPWLVLALAVLLGVFVIDTPTERAVLLIALLPTAIVVALVAARAAWSADAFATQLWVSRDGFGVEPDADRFSPLRPITAGPGRVLTVLTMLVGLTSGAHSVSMAIWEWVVIAVIVAIVLSVLTFERARLSMPRVDAVAPRMFAWSRLREVTVGPARHGSVRVRARFVRARVLPLDVRIAGDDALAAKIGRAMETARGSAIASRPSADV